MQGSQPNTSLIKVLSLLRPATPIGASSLWVRFSFTPAISSTKLTRSLIEISSLVPRLIGVAISCECECSNEAPAEAPEFVVPRFDRTLSAYVNTLTGAGFTLKRLEEPRPSEEYCQAHPGQRFWRDHAALFLHVLAEKPA